MSTYMCNSYIMHISNISSFFLQNIDYIIQNAYVFSVYAMFKGANRKSLTPM